MVWIQDKRLSLLESCKLDKVKCIKPWYYHMYSLLMLAKSFWFFSITAWMESHRVTLTHPSYLFFGAFLFLFWGDGDQHVGGLCWQWFFEILESSILLHILQVVLNHLKVMYLQVKWSGVRTQHSTTPFVDDMYDRLKETLSDYEIIICRWPEYIFGLENVCPDGFFIFQSLFFYLVSDITVFFFI